jgi:hypothetical protein
MFQARPFGVATVLDARSSSSPWVRLPPHLRVRIDIRQRLEHAAEVSPIAELRRGALACDPALDLSGLLRGRSKWD